MIRRLPVSLRKLVAAAVLVGFVPLGSACFGSFQNGVLARKLVGLGSDEPRIVEMAGSR